MITCSQCGGLGEDQSMEVRQHGRFVMQWAVCTACKGTGRTPAPRPAVDPDKREERFDDPLCGLVRAGWANTFPAATHRRDTIAIHISEEAGERFRALLAGADACGMKAEPDCVHPDCCIVWTPGIRGYC